MFPYKFWKIIYLSIYLSRLCWVLLAAHGIFVVACGSFFFLFFSRGMRTLSCGMHAGSSSPNQGSNPGPLHWEHEVLPTGPPGKSLEDY